MADSIPPADGVATEAENVVPFAPAATAERPSSRRGKAAKSKKGDAAEFAPGAAQPPKEFEVAEVSEKLGLWWENGGGDSFWLRNSAGWAKWPMNAVQDFCTANYVRKKPRDGEFLSEQSRLFLHVREHRMIEEVLGGLSGYPSGIHYLMSGERIMVRHSPRLVKPEKGEWPTVEKLLHAKLDLRDEEGHGIDQTPFFHGWMKTALEALYLGGPGNFRPGQALIFAGPKDAGKSRIQHHVITGLLGQRPADPGPYLFGRTDFNAEMFAAEHLMMEDPASSTKTVDRVYFGEMLKGLVVNDTQRLHQKREDAMIVAPFFRVTISVNNDPDKMRVLPLLTPDMKDKLHLFLVSSAPLPMPTNTLAEREAFRNQIASELPAYAWWLLNEYEIPEELRSVRMGVREWHHPTLALELFDDTPAAELLTIIDAAEFRAIGAGAEAESYKLWELTSHAKEEVDEWIGSALELERLLLGEHGDWSCTVAREAKRLIMHNKIDRLLSRLKEDAADRVVHKRYNDARRWLVAKGK